MDRNGNGTMTVREFADTVGVTRQRIYQLIDEGELRRYVLNDHGRMMLKSDGLRVFDKDQGSSGAEALSEDPEVIILRKQLEEKDRQISSLLSVIHELTSIIQGGQHGQ